MNTSSTTPSDTTVAMCHIVSESDLIGGGGGSRMRARRRQGGGERRRENRLPHRTSSRRSRIRAGLVLRLMDLCACASAEKLSGHNSVTLSMDDVTFEDPEAAVGDILTVKARVNAAWGTSMEVGALCVVEGGGGGNGGSGIGATSGGSTRRICRAFTTFVSLSPESGSKIRLPQMTASTDEDVRRRRMAEERRRIRFRRGDILKSRSRAKETVDGGTAEGGGNDNDAEEIDPDAATVLTEIVLPQHANHHGNTFGGQIMEWMMDKAAVVAAMRHAGSPPSSSSGFASPRRRLNFAVKCVDDVFFVGPSSVGDRLEMVARPVWYLGGRELEVSVTVHAFGLNRREKRMVNKAFCVVEALVDDEDEDEDESEDDANNDAVEVVYAGDDDNQEKDPSLLPEVALSRRSSLKDESDAARGRAALRLRRLSIRSSAFDLAWKYEDCLADMLCSENVSQLLEMQWGGGWIDIDDDGGSKESEVRLHFKIHQGCLIGRMVATLPTDVGANELSEVLLDNKRRPEWDSVLVSAQTLAVIDDSNDVQRLVVRAPQLVASDEKEGNADEDRRQEADQRRELVVLRSWRKDSPQNGGRKGSRGQKRAMVIANHSILHHPAESSLDEEERGGERIARGIVGSSGWIVEDAEHVGGSGKLTYFATLGPSTSALAREVALGRSREHFVKSFGKVVEFVRSRRTLLQT